MRIYLIRHADPNYTTDSLTEQGRQEASALASFLSGQRIKRLFCSPLGRARETARHVAELLGMEPEIEEWTREMKGHRLPGREDVHWNVPGEEVRIPGYLGNLHDWSAIPSLSNLPLQEAWEALVQASDEFLQRLGYVREDAVYRITRHQSERIAVICHGGFGLTWLSHLLAIPFPLVWSGFLLRTSSVTTLLMEERSPGQAVPRCIGLGDMSHLYLQGLEPGISGFTANTE